MSRFDFLKGREDALYDMCKQVEKYQGVDTDIFMLKSRRALEQIVTKLGCQGHTLREKVDDINSKLNISGDMKNRIIKFKNLCNEIIHYEEGKSATVAVDSALDELVDICKWLVDAKIEKKVETVIESNIKLLQEKQRELEKAFKNNDMTAVARISDEIKDLSTSQSIDIKRIKNLNFLAAQKPCKQYKRTAEKGDDEAKKAYKRYKRAAEKGNKEAQYNLALCYKNGDGIKTNAKKAVEWFQSALEYSEDRSKQQVLAEWYKEVYGTVKCANCASYGFASHLCQRISSENYRECLSDSNYCIYWWPDGVYAKPLDNL